MGLIKNTLGEFSWTPPGWAVRLGAGRLFALLVSLAVLTVIAITAWKYYETLPVPPRVIASAVPPEISPIVNDQVRPQPVIINFQIKTDPRQPVEASNAIARVDLIQSSIPEGVSMEPAMEGTWRWLSDQQMSFTPNNDWPANQLYTVRYQPVVFAPGLAFEKHTVDFTTPAFSAQLSELTFYQDPVDTTLRKVVATLDFSHPVELETLEKAISLTLREDGQTINDTPTALDVDITLEPSGRKAYVHSGTLDIPERETFATFSVNQRLTSLASVAPLPEALTQTVRIPDVTTYFKVDSQQFLLVSDEQDEPQQTVTLSFTDRVSTEDLKKKLTVYRLPNTITVNGKASNKSYWESAREVTPDILSQSQTVPFELNPQDTGSAMLHSLRLDVTTNRYYYLHIDQGLRSNGEFVLSTAYDSLFYVSPYPEEVSIAQEGAILPLTGSHRVHFVSRGVSALKVEIGRLLERDVNHLASQIDGDITDPRFTNWRFNQDNLTEREDQYITLPSSHPKKASYAHLDLSDALKEGGYYFLRVSGWNPQGGYETGGSDQRIVLITDLGFVSKVSANGEQDLFVHSLSTGNPVAGATIDLLGKNGIPVRSATTSTDGHARLSSANGLVREKTPTVYIVRSGRDSVFMPYGRHTRQLDYSRFDVGGEYADVDGSQLRAQLFTERDLYRPGDVVHMAAIVKRGNWGSLDRLPLRWTVRDSRGQLILDKPLRLPADGFIEQRLQTDPASSTGTYEMALYTVEQRNRRRYLGGHQFKVEEFQPDRLRIVSRVSGQKPKGWLKPDALTVQVQLDNLFGTPATNRRLQGSARLQAKRMTFRDYEGYVFTDPLRRNDTAQTIERTLAATTTDDSGAAEIPLNLGRFEGGIYQLTVYTEGFEAGGGRSVKSQSQVMVSPLDHVIGFKADGNLDYIQKESSRVVDFLAVNSDAESVALGSLTKQIIERRFVSTLVKQRDGTFAYQSISKDVVLNEEPYSISAGGSRFTLPTERAGRYAVQLVNPQGTVYARVPFVIAGARNIAGNLEQNAELELTLNKGSYAPGEPLELQITAPYTGTGLITIERDRVLAYQWFKSSTTSSTQTIPLPNDLEGNAYVNVTFMRDLNSKEIYVSPLSYAVAPFSIKRAARTIEVTLNVAEKSLPGEPLTIEYQTSKPGKIVLFAVDQGILQVANYSAPKPLDFFLRKRALRVNTFQLADLVLPEFVAGATSAAPGGGEAASLAGKNLNPFRRKTDAPVVFWSGIMNTDTSTQTVTYQVPDYFNGELTVMAVAVADDAVGDALTQSTVQGPFVISPNLPVSVAPGDEFDVSVALSNNVEGSGAKASVRLSAVPSKHLRIIEDASRTLIIDEGREDSVVFKVRATDHTGSATLAFTAETGAVEATLTSSLSVRPATPFTTSLQSGVHDTDPITLPVERELREELSVSEVAASTDPIILASGLQNYLEGFPHACAEQIVSKVFPQVGLYGRDQSLNSAELRTQFNQTVARLRTRQLPSGGFRFWVSSNEAAEFPSVYVTHFLTEASTSGLPVSDALLQNALNYLRELSARSSNTADQARLRAYAIYVLTRNGVVTTNYLTSLQEQLTSTDDLWKQDITAVYMAASYKLLKLDELADTLIGGYTLQGGNEMFSDFDTRLGRDAQFVLLLAKHFPARLKQLDGNQLRQLVTPVFENRFNTLSSAYTVLALQAYGAAKEQDGTALSLIDDAGNALSTKQIIATAQLSHQVRAIQVAGGNGDTVFTALTQTGFDAKVATSPASNGLEIDRRFLNAQGSPVSTAQLGDELTVRVRVRSTGQPRTNVAVVDLLPGGFEVLTDSVRDQYNGWMVDYMDVREDRVVTYGTFGDELTEFSYQVKVTAAGTFTVPAAYARSMYNLSVNAHTAADTFTVTRATP